jgi:hypothetical protein
MSLSFYRETGGDNPVHQRVNLFQPIFRKERKLFSFTVCVQMVVMFTLTLIFLYFFGWRNVNTIESDLAVVKKQNDTHLAQLASVTQKIKSLGDSANTADQINQLRDELEAERYMLQVLGNDYSQHRLGFSSYLEGFARRSIQGMWISAFEMKNGGRSVQITGGTLSPEIIPDFLSGLTKEASLQGTSFEVLTMDRKTPNGNWIEFALSSGDFSDSPFETSK